MRILHLITSLDRGGAENYLTCLCRAQIKAHDVSIVYLKGDDYWANFLKVLGVRIYKLKRFNFLNQISSIKNYIKKEKIDILHCHLSYMEILGYFSCFFDKSIGLIITKHVDNNYLGGSIKKRKSFVSNWLSRFIYNKAKHIICISKAVRSFLIKNNPTSFLDKKTSVIYYGIDKFYINECLFKKEKTDFFFNKQKIKFCFIGRLVKQKQVDSIIHCFSKLKKKHADVALIIVGNGPEESELKNLAKKLNLLEDITWIEFVEDVGSVLEQIDVLCLNSSFEGLGLILLEAMAIGKPIIAPNISAFPEVIKNNVNGILTNQENQSSFLDAMTLMLNYEFRQKLSKNAPEILHNKFSYDFMINKTEELYKK